MGGLEEIFRNKRSKNFFSKTSDFRTSNFFVIENIRSNRIIDGIMKKIQFMQKITFEFLRPASLHCFGN